MLFELSPPTTTIAFIHPLVAAIFICTAWDLKHSGQTLVGYGHDEHEHADGYADEELPGEHGEPERAA